jgi:Recombinase zinc beta ribbon domain
MMSTQLTSAFQTFEQIQAIIQDNSAAYDRNKTRGVPRPGSALLQGMVACGECGHKMVVQYKRGTRYLCNSLRQKYRVPVCQHIPADAVDAQVVEAFFQALSTVELDVYERAVAAQQAEEQQVTHAHQQHLSRLRYETALAQRQFVRVDPENRLVAASLEKRWEAALAELKQAEEAAVCPVAPSASLLSVPLELQTAFKAIGQHLPALWQQGLMTPQHKKALLRCLIDLVVVQRPSPEWVQARIVWRGGETTQLQIPVPVGALSDLAGAQEMERIILQRSAQGATDEVMASELTAQGYRSPMHPFVLPSTVKIIRLKQGQFQVRSQSHPRRVAGALTLSQIAKALDIAPHWIDDRINNGCIQITKDSQTNLYLFPDDPATLEQFKQLRAGTLKELRFSKEHQDA